MRLDKLISNLGLLSRSECKAAVKKGRITVNGVPAEDSGIKIDPDKDKICLDGQRINTGRFVYYMFNKPAGTITANEDRDSAVVFDYIRDPRPDLSAVGRLDKDTTGILLITNDGELNHRLLSPKNHVQKTYQVWIDGMLTQQDIESLTGGMDIGDDRLTLPAEVRIIGKEQISCAKGKTEDTCEIDIVSVNAQHIELKITEGRYHQVKRMFAGLGKPVLKLHRSGFGLLELDEKLKPGEYRELTGNELSLLVSGKTNR